MKPADFEFISQLVNKRSGLVLTKDKAYLLESRLMPVARKRGLKGLEDLISAIRTSKEEGLLRPETVTACAAQRPGAERGDLAVDLINARRERVDPRTEDLVAVARLLLDRAEAIAEKAERPDSHQGAKEAVAEAAIRHRLVPCAVRRGPPVRAR